MGRRVGGPEWKPLGEKLCLNLLYVDEGFFYHYYYSLETENTLSPPAAADAAVFSRNSLEHI